jgi:transcriptional regulator with XRE-family HTH domain
MIYQILVNPEDWEHLKALGREINRLLGDRTQQWLAEQTGVRQATISRILNGKQAPTFFTLDKIAKALEVDPLHLMRVAGLPLPPDSSDIDPEIEYIAQRLAVLPPTLRQAALAAIRSQVEAWHQVAELRSQLVARIRATDPEGAAEIDRLLTDDSD